MGNIDAIQHTNNTLMRLPEDYREGTGEIFQEIITETF